MAFAFRLHRKEDEPELIRLWCEHSGWDRPEPETWTNRLMCSPYGETRIVVAEDADTGRIVGQFVFIQSTAMIGDREIPILRPFAPVVAPMVRHALLRRAPLMTLPMRMYMHGAKIFRQMGYQLLYALPDPRWQRFLRLVPDFQFATFPLWSLRLPLESTLPLEGGFTEVDIPVTDPRVDELWHRFKKLHACSLVRNSRFWAWKSEIYHYKITGVEKDGELVGIAGSVKKGDRQWLICDMLFSDAAASLRATLSAVCNLAHRQACAASPDEPIVKAAILATPVMEPVIKDLGFYRDAYDFSLFTHKLDRTVAKGDVDPAKWYACAND